jgi:hypothetical protein
MTFTGVSNGNTPSGQTLTISNTGNSTLNWTAGSVPGKAANWCHSDTSSGTLAANASQNVTVSVNSPSNIGSFTDCGIRISDSNASNNPQDLSITYTVSAPAIGSPGGGASGSVTTGSFASCPAGVKVTWNSGANATSYNIYRSPHGQSAGAALATVGNVNSYNDTTAVGKNDYWVQSVGNATLVPADQNNSGTSPNTCSGGGNVNLLTSDKDIIAINGNTVLSSGNQPPQSCNATTDILPVDNYLNIGDVLTFQISLCNTGTDPATGITVNDVMVNLQQAGGNWNAKYNGQALIYDGATNSGLVNHYHVTGTSPNQTLVFNLTSSADDVAVNSAGTLTYNAQLFAPQDTSGNIGRFSNQFTAYFNPSQSVARATPLLPFSLGKGIPTIREIP